MKKLPYGISNYERIVEENYYDIKKVDKFKKLFGETYIGKNPTVNKI